MSRQSEFPLRQRKYVRTKLALMNATLDRIKEKSLEGISVRELCAAAEVSEATFFNYFPGKTDLLAYFVQLWTIEAGWHAQRALETRGGLAAIEALFEFTAQRHAENPAAMEEIIAWQARQKGEVPLSDVTAVERTTAFPTLEGIEDMPSEGLDSILPDLIAKAIEQGELPEELDITTVAMALEAILFGIPIVQRNIEGQSVGELYSKQLDLILKERQAPKTNMTTRRSAPDTGEAFPWS